MLKNWPQILRLALPNIVSYATMTLTMTLVLIILGHMGSLSIAIVGVVNIVMYNVWALFSGISNTINYLVAQNFGEQDMRTGVERTQIALVISFLCGTAAVIVGTVAPAAILGLLGNSEQYVEEGAFFLQLRFYAMFFVVLSAALQGFFRGIGDTKTPMFLALTGSVLTVALAYAMAYGRWGFPELGLDGAGYAFVIGEGISFAVGVYLYFVRLHPRFQTRSIKPRFKGEAKLILRESGKLGVQEFMLSIAMFIFTVFVSYLGEEALAANEVSLNIMSFGFMPAFAFASTATILVGQEIGRGRALIARRLGTDTAIIGSLFLIVIGLVQFFLSGPIAHLYTNDPAVYELAAFLIKISAFMQLFDGLLNFYAGGLRGTGDTTFLLKSSFFFSWFVFVPLAYLAIFVFDLGSVGAWIALYTYLTFFGLTIMLRYYRTDWLSLRIKKADPS